MSLFLKLVVIKDTCKDGMGTEGSINDGKKKYEYI